MKLLAILFFFSISIFAKDFKTLHVSAWPANTEIYAEKLTPDYSTKADYTTPAAIQIPLNQNKISLTFFQPLFRDSTIEVTIPDLEDSYLMVILDKESNPDKIYFQEQNLKKRTKRSVGKGMMFSSIIPFGIASFTLIKNYLEYKEANDIREELKHHKIYTSKTESLKQDFNQHKNKSENYKTATYWFSGIGVALLSIGFYLHF